MDVGAGAGLADPVHPVGALLVFGIVPVDAVVHHRLRGGQGQALGAGVQLSQEHPAGRVILEALHDGPAVLGFYAAIDAHQGKPLLSQHAGNHSLHRVHLGQEPGEDDQLLPFVQHQALHDVPKGVQLGRVHLVPFAFVVHQESARQLLQAQHAHQHVVRGHLAAVLQFRDALLLKLAVQLPGLGVQFHRVIFICLGWQV